MNNEKKQDFPNRKVLLFYFLFAFPHGGRCHGEAVTDEGARPYAAFFSLVRHRSATVVAATTVSATAPT